MSRRKTERLLSLVVCLLSAGRFLTATQIRAAVPGYPDTFDALKRMFERDKDARARHPAGDRDELTGGRGSRVPHLPAGLHAAGDQA